ncbi:MAG: RNA polymerase sigma factor [Acidimicrobiales bacterium]
MLTRYPTAADGLAFARSGGASMRQSIIESQPIEHTSIAPTFESFYRAEFPRMVALATSMLGRTACAEDLAQEAMVRAHRKWSTIGAYEKPGAWVRRVTINLATSRARRLATETKATLGLIGRGLEPIPEAREHHDDLWSAVASLPTNQRAAIALRYLDDLPDIEIANILGCSHATARVHLHRAHKKLADILGHDAPAAIDPKGGRS